MNRGLEQVREAVSKALETAGLAVCPAFSPGWAKRYDGPVAAVGLRPTELRWEEAVWDETTAMFLRRGSFSCSAYFVATATEEGAWLTDFILKGVVTP